MGKVGTQKDRGAQVLKVAQVLRRRASIGRASILARHKGYLRDFQPELNLLERLFIKPFPILLRFFQKGDAQVILKELSRRASV